METELTDLFRSLASICEEETALLQQGRRGEVAGLVQAKTRLVGAVDAEVARLDRVAPDWRETLDANLRAELGDLALRLRDSARDNGAALRRQIDLSDDLMTQIAADARRRKGGRSEAYGATGAMTLNSVAVPISLNASL